MGYEVGIWCATNSRTSSTCCCSQCPRVHLSETDLGPNNTLRIFYALVNLTNHPILSILLGIFKVHECARPTPSMTPQCQFLSHSSWIVCQGGKTMNAMILIVSTGWPAKTSCVRTVAEKGKPPGFPCRFLHEVMAETNGRVIVCM